MLIRLSSRDGRGGAGLLGVAKDFPESAPLIETASFVKNDSSLVRSPPFDPFSLLGIPKRRTWASRWESCSGFSLRRAFCVASRAVGEGGRGAGFIACATVRGIVGMLHEDMTGSARK